MSPKDVTLDGIGRPSAPLVARRDHAEPSPSLAHIANRFGRVERDFETGEHDGVRSALDVIGTIAHAWLAREEGACAASANHGSLRHAG